MGIRILRSADVPWGDYGDILVHGMAHHLGRDSEGRIRLERTGPSIRPVTFPGLGTIIVTEPCRALIESARFDGLVFRPVVKARVVDLAWERWDQAAPQPPQYPRTAEPEGYILERRHAPEVAAALGPLWELIPPVAARTARRERRDVEIVLLQSTWTGADLFRAEGVGYVYASERAQEWLGTHLGEFVAFDDCLVE
jgi:hypothetical protein